MGVGMVVGTWVGMWVGRTVGRAVGTVVGMGVGTAVGTLVGTCVGMAVGTMVGREVAAWFQGIAGMRYDSKQEVAGGRGLEHPPWPHSTPQPHHGNGRGTTMEFQRAHHPTLHANIQAHACHATFGLLHIIWPTECIHALALNVTTSNGGTGIACHDAQLTDIQLGN